MEKWSRERRTVETVVELVPAMTRKISVVLGTFNEVCRTCCGVVSLKNGRWRHLSPDLHQLKVALRGHNSLHVWAICMWLMPKCTASPAFPASQTTAHMWTWRVNYHRCQRTLPHLLSSAWPLPCVMVIFITKGVLINHGFHLGCVTLEKAQR